MGANISRAIFFYHTIVGARSYMKKNQANRRRAALERLRNTSFTGKGKRTEKEWKERVEQEIKTLKERIV